MNKYVPGTGNPHAKIMLIGEAPSYDEEKTLKPFTGPSGRILDECLRNSGIDRSSIWLTNVFKSAIIPQQRDGRKIPGFVRAEQSGQNVQKSIIELRVEINEIKPNVICLLGGTALWAMFGKDKITQWRGSILHLWNYKVVPTYHPAAILHSEEGRANYWQKVIIELDLRRVKKQSEFSEIHRPSRNLQVCRNSAQLSEFYERGLSLAQKSGQPIKLAVDIEAIHCIPVCISLSYEITSGLCIPLWNKTKLVKISDIPFSDLTSIWLLTDQILNDPHFLIVGQNFKYDEDKINRLGFTIPRLYSDTMLKAFCINPELSVSLAFNTSVYTEEPYYKDEGLEFDYTKNKIDDLFLYGAKDAPITLEIDNAMDEELIDIGQVDFYHNFLMKLHGLYLSIESRGMRIIEENRIELLRKYIKWSEQLAYELWRDTGNEINVQSPKQIAILLYEVLKLPKRAGTGEEVLTQLLANAVKKTEHKKIVENILTKRRIEKTIGTYLMALPDFDGRMKTSYFICLETGRTSTSLLEPPIRPSFEVKEVNIITGKKTKKKKHIGAGFQVLTKHGDVGGDLRKMYGPDEGDIFLQADSLQAEARVVTLLANDEVMLRSYDTNDVHALTASWFVGGSESDWSKKKLGYEHPNRFLGKTLRHAGHLGAKKTRAALEINTQARKYNIPVNVSESFCDIALKIFHNKCPNIQSVFHAEVIKEIQKYRVLIAPLPYGIKSKIGGRRTFYEHYSDDLFRQSFSYLPQRAISDNTKAAALRIREREPKIKIIVESHDSLLFSIPLQSEQYYGPIIKEEMEREIDFTNCSLPRRKLSIPCDLEIGENYLELRKFKI